MMKLHASLYHGNWNKRAIAPPVLWTGTLNLFDKALSTSMSVDVYCHARDVETVRESSMPLAYAWDGLSKTIRRDVGNMLIR